MYDMYIGSYQDPGESGIHHWRVDKSGILHPLHIVKGIGNPSYLCLDADRGRLYAVSETESHPAVVTLSLASDGRPRRLHGDVSRPTSGSSPCHCSILTGPDGLLVANYGGGTLDTFALTAAGALGRAQSVRHQGHGRHPTRQTAPHPHSSALDPDGHFIWVCDLGIDAIIVYRRVGEDGHLVRVASVATQPGSGPRMMTFHPRQPYFYVVHELDSTVGVYRYRSEGPECACQQILSTLDGDTSGVGENWPAHLAISPDGKMLYVSNRGHDSLAVYAVSEVGDRLELIRVVPTSARFPRHFAFTPDHRWMLVAGQRADGIEVMPVAEDGIPRPGGRCWPVTAPTCIVVSPYDR